MKITFRLRHFFLLIQVLHFCLHFVLPSRFAVLSLLTLFFGYFTYF